MDVHVMYPCKLWHFLKLGIMNSIKVAYFSSHCIMTEWFVNVFENGEAFNANENKSVTFQRELWKSWCSIFSKLAAWPPCNVKIVLLNSSDVDVPACHFVDRLSSDKITETHLWRVESTYKNQETLKLLNFCEEEEIWQQIQGTAGHISLFMAIPPTWDVPSGLSMTFAN